MECTIKINTRNKQHVAILNMLQVFEMVKEKKTKRKTVQEKFIEETLEAYKESTEGRDIYCGSLDNFKKIVEAI